MLLAASNIRGYLERSYTKDDDKLLTSVECEKDLGVGVDSGLSFIELIAKKANNLDAVIRKRLLKITENCLRTLYKGLIKRHLKYANQTWNPHLTKYKILIENIQRRATKRMPHLSGLSYSDGLKILNLPTLEFRRRRGRKI